MAWCAAIRAFFNAGHQHCAWATVSVAPLQRRHCGVGAFPHRCRRALQGKTPAIVCNTLRLCAPQRMPASTSPRYFRPWSDLSSHLAVRDTARPPLRVSMMGSALLSSAAAGCLSNEVRRAWCCDTPACESALRTLGPRSASLPCM